jgi:deoxyribonuclease-4
MPRIGAHIHVDNPLAEAIAYGAGAVQFFLGDPQGWKGPVIPGGDAAAIKAAYAAADMDIYIHAPYVINVATSNNRIRIPSRKLLDQQLRAAASIGAKGLIVHGGHVTAGVDFAEGLENWRKASGTIDPALLLGVVRSAGATAICETPEEDGGLAADVSWLKQRTTASSE